MAGDGTIRSDFAELLSSEDRAGIVSALKEAASATKRTRCICEKCKHENYVEISDVRTVLEVVKFMTEQGLGKLLVEDVRRPTDELRKRSHADMASVSDDELALLQLDADGNLPDLGESAYEVALRVVAEHDGPVAVEA